MSLVSSENPASEMDMTTKRRIQREAPRIMLCKDSKCGR